MLPKVFLAALFASSYVAALAVPPQADGEALVVRAEAEPVEALVEVRAETDAVVDGGAEIDKAKGKKGKKGKGAKGKKGKGGKGKKGKGAKGKGKAGKGKGAKGKGKAGKGKGAKGKGKEAKGKGKARKGKVDSDEATE